MLILFGVVFWFSGLAGLLPFRIFANAIAQFAGAFRQLSLFLGELRELLTSFGFTLKGALKSDQLFNFLEILPNPLLLGLDPRLTVFACEQFHEHFDRLLRVGLLAHGLEKLTFIDKVGGRLELIGKACVPALLYGFFEQFCPARIGGLLKRRHSQQGLLKFGHAVGQLCLFQRNLARRRYVALGVRATRSAVSTQGAPTDEKGGHPAEVGMVGDLRAKILAKSDSSKPSLDASPFVVCHWHFALPSFFGQPTPLALRD